MIPLQLRAAQVVYAVATTNVCKDRLRISSLQCVFPIAFI